MKNLDNACVLNFRRNRNVTVKKIRKSVSTFAKVVIKSQVCCFLDAVQLPFVFTNESTQRSGDHRSNHHRLGG